MSDVKTNGDTGGQSSASGPLPLGRRAKRFDARRLERELVRDRGTRRAALGLLIFLALVGVMWGGDRSEGLEWVAGTMVWVMIAVWVGMSMVQAQAARLMPEVGRLIGPDPAGAEDRIARGLAKWPLHPSLRLAFYHRLVLLRHREGKLPEAAAIAQEVLMRRLGAVENIRPQLLLILLEIRLAYGDLVGAYQAIEALHRLKLNGGQMRSLLPLQTRYEVMAGHDGAVLHRLGEKVAMGERLPSSEAGAYHALVAVAARRSGRDQLADFFMERARLLCEPSEFNALTTSVQYTA